MRQLNLLPLGVVWPLSDVRKIEPRIRYKHPGGGSWVTLSAPNVSDFDRLQRGE
jgi:hypothetical protein